jgi:Protein of unknown function (DUF4089)
MKTPEMLLYVKVSAQVAGLDMCDEQAVRVTQHLERTWHMARMLDAFDMPEHRELAQMFVPAPFPANGEAK